MPWDIIIIGRSMFYVQQKEQMKHNNIWGFKYVIFYIQKE
jgi:hypothetical protein